jgi:hypothetical protein
MLLTIYNIQSSSRVNSYTKKYLSYCHVFSDFWNNVSFSGFNYLSESLLISYSYCGHQKSFSGSLKK